MEKYIVIVILWLFLEFVSSFPSDFQPNPINSWRHLSHPNVLEDPLKLGAEPVDEKTPGPFSMSPARKPQYDIRSSINRILNAGKPIPVQIPVPIFTNVTKPTISSIMLNTTEGSRAEIPIEAVTEEALEAVTTEAPTTPSIFEEEPTEGAQEEPTAAPESTTPKDDYNQKLALVLANIQQILPALAQLQENMTELLQHSNPVEVDYAEEIQAIEDPSLYPEPVQITQPEILGEHVPHSAQDFSFPQPNITENLDREYIHSLIRTLYITDGNSFENLTKIVNTMPPESQLTAYEELNNIIIENSKKAGRQDILKMGCLVFGKPRFEPIVRQSGFYSQTIFPLFFQSQSKFALEARSKLDGFKVFFFDRKKIHFGITNAPEPGIFTEWTFHPIKDGSCHFLIQSENFLVGVDVAKSEESPLLAKFVLGIAGLEEGQFDDKYQWKIHPIRTLEKEHPYLLFENRGTNLAIEWNEEEDVVLNAVNFTKPNQLWHI